eukprot:scaffold272598_cov30-Tisochrysis_lutea.AAC.2
MIRIRSGLPAANRRATRATCDASSRDGARISACAEAIGRIVARIGSRYVRVLPEPVCARTIASLPCMMGRTAAAWTGVGRVKPSVLARSTSQSGSPKLPSDLAHSDSVS